jgi:hypothetical protein
VEGCELLRFVFGDAGPKDEAVAVLGCLCGEEILEIFEGWWIGHNFFSVRSPRLQVLAAAARLFDG